MTGSVTGFGKITGKRIDSVKVAGKFMKGVLVTILPICMVVQTAHYHRTAGGAACRCRKGVKEDGAVFCQISIAGVLAIGSP